MSLNKTIVTFYLLLTAVSASCAGYYHLLSGGGGGYQFSIFQAPAIKDVIDIYNNQLYRNLWNGSNGSKMTGLDQMHGYFCNYAFYKYIDKSRDMLTSFQISGEFEHSFAGSESWFLFKTYDKVYRNYDYSYNSITLSFDYGWSPVKKWLIYGGIGLGYDHFSLESYLDYPDNLSSYEVEKFENDNFNQENLTNKLKIENGKYTGDGVSVKAQVRTEYYILPELEANLSLQGRYIYIDRLKKGKLNLRKNQFSTDPLVLEAMQYAVRLGINYYFVLE